MKRFILLTIISVPLTLFAQYRSAAIKLGYMNPEATSGGFIIGYEGSFAYDRSLSFGWSIDWFHKNYVDETLVEEFNQLYGIPDGTINELRAKTNLHEIPLMFNAAVRFPLAPRFQLYLTGAIGGEVLLIFYNNFENPNEDEFKAAFDFSWRAGAGTSIRIGPRSEFFGEMVYHASQPSWTYEVFDPNTGRKRTFERKFDMSGVITRAGVRFFF